MKKVFLVALLPLFLLVHPIAAQVNIKGTPSGLLAPNLYPAPPPQPFPFLGEQHYYSVTFRGNGEAVVALKAILSNVAGSPKSGQTVQFRVPRVQPTDIMAYQVLLEKRCIQYGQVPLNTQNLSVVPGCTEYQNPDYSQGWFGTAKYQKATTEIAGDTITITLPQPIQSNAQGAIILYYRAFGYARKNPVGGVDFAFETLKVDDKIDLAQVGIDVDTDFYLRGSLGKVNYRIEDGFGVLKATAGIAAPTANSRFDQFYGSIGQGELTKTAKDLQPLDSYTAKGSYADSRVKLYWKEIGIGVGIAIFLVLFIMWLVGVLTRYVRRTRSAPMTSMNQVLVAGGVSVCSACLILAYTMGLIFFMKYFFQNANSVYPELMTATMFLMGLLTVAVYSLLLFAPAVFLGLRNRVRLAALTLGMTLLWVGMVFFVFLLFLLLAPRAYPYRILQTSPSYSGSTSVQMTPQGKTLPESDKISQ